jgi:hypothetical protein
LYQVVARIPSSFGTPGFTERFWPRTDSLPEALRIYREVATSRPNATEVRVVCAESMNPPDLDIQVSNYANGRYYTYIDTTEELLRNSIEFAPLNENDEPWTEPKALWRLFLHRDILRRLIQLMGRRWAEGSDLGGPDDGLEKYGPMDDFQTDPLEPAPERYDYPPSEEAAGNEEP